MVLRKHPLGMRRRDHRAGGVLRDGPKLPRSVSSPVPCNDERTPGAPKTVHDLPANRRVGSGRRRFVCQGERVGSAATRPDIERQRQEHRAGTRAGGRAVGLLRRTLSAGDAVHARAPASHRAHEGDRIDAVGRRILNGAARRRRRGHVAADEDERQLLEERRRDSRERVRNSGPARRQHERRSPRDHRVSERAERGHRLVTGHHEFDLGDVRERVEHRADEPSGDPERPPNPARCEDLKHGSRDARFPHARVLGLQDNAALHDKLLRPRWRRRKTRHPAAYPLRRPERRPIALA